MRGKPGKAGIPCPGNRGGPPDEGIFWGMLTGTADRGDDSSFLSVSLELLELTFGGLRPMKGAVPPLKGLMLGRGERRNPLLGVLK